MGTIPVPILITGFLFLLLQGCVQDAKNAAGNTEWMEVALTDVGTGEVFRISDFKGQKVLVESFAVWCPTCTQQQRIIQQMRMGEGTGVVHVSLDTDPNENEERVRNHIEQNGFDWYYVVAPTEMSQALINEFGLVIVNAPAVPMILVCEDHSARLLPRGLKLEEVLEREIAAGC